MHDSQENMEILNHAILEKNMKKHRSQTFQLETERTDKFTLCNIASAGEIPYDLSAKYIEC